MIHESDIVVVGAGHAGCEAALAAARMGAETVLLTINPDTIAQMSCNPAIGGLAKGQLVREVDALGGEMAKAIDETGIQFRMLNMRKGPAVRSPRAQADRKLYQFSMKRRLEEQPGLTVRQEVAEALLVKDGRVVGVKAQGGAEYRARAVVLATGTFLRGVIHIGNAVTTGGRIGEPSADILSTSLEELGIRIGRLKTGTPPRVNGRTIDYSKTQPQYGDETPVPFSFSTDKIERPQVPCHITFTNARTHDVIRRNLDRAPLYTGQIKSTGPRYCPSIEVKIVRFADKESHQVFLEPEGLNTTEVYCNGLATSIPRDVQEEMIHSIPGLEDAEITRYGYAIEYDFVPPTQTKPNLESKAVENLFPAGQINGTSGYEEAAAQGIMAGINAVLKIRGEEPFVLDRSEAYIGVLIDDLVTKGTDEPYRMFTSRAEYRLLLRHDNADRRLMPHGRRLGLISEEQYERLREKERQIQAAREYLRTHNYGKNPLEKYLRRPKITMGDVIAVSPGLADVCPDKSAREQAEIEVKYAGYVERQQIQIERFKRMEHWRIPPELDYSEIAEMRLEAREKLAEIRPISLGQASRICGVSPADISILMVFLKAKQGGKSPGRPDARQAASSSRR